jgi:hypothetical protein
MRSREMTLGGNSANVRSRFGKVAPRERGGRPRAALQLRRRGPLSLERLSALADGRLAYRMKRPSPTGQTHLVMAPVAFLRRPAALVPPPRANLVRYFGVFALNARVRPRVVPVPPRSASLTEAASCPGAPEPLRPRPPRRPMPRAELLRRSFQGDVPTCPRCGGTRRVVAVVLRSATAQAIPLAGLKPPGPYSASSARTRFVLPWTWTRPRWGSPATSADEVLDPPPLVVSQA